MTTAPAAALYAFYLEHRWCGDLDAGVEDERAFRTLQTVSELTPATSVIHPRHLDLEVSHADRLHRPAAAHARLTGRCHIAQRRRCARRRLRERNDSAVLRVGLGSRGLRQRDA